MASATGLELIGHTCKVSQPSSWLGCGSQLLGIPTSPSFLFPPHVLSFRAVCSWKPQGPAVPLPQKTRLLLPGMEEAALIHTVLPISFQLAGGVRRPSENPT